MNTGQKLLIVIIIILFGAAPLFPQNLNDALRLSQPELGSSVRALGMGNAFTAISDDYAGVKFNPAGIGLVNSMEYSASLGYHNFNSESSFFGTTTDYSNSETNFEQFGFVLPFPTKRGSFSLAFGYSRDKDFNRAVKFDGFNSGNNSLAQDLTYANDDLAFLLGLSYPLSDEDDEYIEDRTIINGNLNQRGNILEEGNLNSWSFSAAVEIAKNVFLGGTLNILSGKYKRDKEYFEEDTRDVYGIDTQTDPEDPDTRDFERFYVQDILDWEVSGWDVKLGLLYKVPHAQLGFTVKFPSRYSINETYFVDGNSDFGTGVRFVLDEPYYSEIEYDIDTPFEFAAGGAYVYRNLIVSGEFTFIDYTQMEFTEGLTPDIRSDNNRDIREFTQTAFNYNLGVEFIVPRTGISLRGGFIQQGTPFDDDIVESERKYVTAGIGFTVPRGGFTFNLAYAHGWWEDYTDNYGVGESRVFQDVTVDKFLVGINYSL